MVSASRPPQVHLHPETRVSSQTPGSEHNTSEEGEVPGRSVRRGAAGACAGVQPPEEHPSAAAAAAATAAFSRPPLSAWSALLWIRLSLIKIDMNLFLVAIAE